MFLSGSANDFCGTGCTLAANAVAGGPTEANNRIHACFMVMAFY